MSNLSELLPAGSGAKVAEFVASGTLASGQTVVLKTDGQVEAVAAVSQSASVGSATQITSNITQDPSLVYDASSGKVVFTYIDSQNNNYATAAVGTISGTSISFGTPVVIYSGAVGSLNTAYDSANEKIIVVYRSGANSYGYAHVGTVSGTSISFGSDYNFTTAATSASGYGLAYDTANSKFVVTYSDSGNSDRGTAKVGTVSGTAISYGSATVYQTGGSSWPDLTYDSANGKVVAVVTDNSTTNIKAYVGTVSGTSITFGSGVIVNSGNTGEFNAIGYDVQSGKVIVAYEDRSNSYYGTAKVGTVSGTSISFGTAVVFRTVNTGNAYFLVGYDAGVGRTNIFFRIYDPSDQGLVATGTVSGTSITFDSNFTVSSSNRYVGAAYDSVNKKWGYYIRPGANDLDGVVFTTAGTSTNLTATNFLGITNAAISNSATGEVVPQGGVITNSNFLPPVYAPSSGTPVVFEAGDIGNSNGLPSVAFDSNSNKIVIAYTDVANSNQGTVIVGTVSGTGISYGTAVVFETGSTSYSSVVFDSNSNKIVIAYRDAGDSNYGKAIVGTVSGTSISFGTAVTFETANSDHISATFDSNSNKVVIAYRDDGNSSYGTAIVGTVSGTSISFGTAVVYASVNAQSKSMAFDSNLNKVIIAFRNFNNAGYSWAVVGTVSGTSISFGTTVVYSSTGTEHLSVIFDSSNNKAVLTSRDSNNKGIAVVGTVSGTSISFGSAVIYSGSSTADWGFAVFDAAANKVVISYSDLSNSSHGTVIVGTVSGTSITFGTPVVFNNAGDTNYIGSGFDSNLNKVVTAYQDANNSNYGTSVVVTITGASPALTIGTDYFVQTDGTLSTTTSTVPAGRALSATSILLEG